MTEPQTPKRLTDFSTLQFPEDALRLEDIKDEEITLVGARIGTGKFGEYANIEVTTADKTNVMIVTSGMLVIEALKNAIAASAFPLLAKFTRTGKCWRIE